MQQEQNVTQEIMFLSNNDKLFSIKNIHNNHDLKYHTFTFKNVLQNFMF